MPKPNRQPNALYEAILKLAPAIPLSAVYTQDDLISEVYLLAVKKQLQANQIADLKKLVREASYRRYRPKYKAHSTANLTAEELLLFCSNRLEPQPEIDEQPKATIWDYLRAALSANQ